MGIPGLTSYILQRSENFSRNFELHNSLLVIDGNCILIQLYLSNKINCCFGGDYAEFAYYVSEFFDDLLNCKITPLIIFDGGIEDKKMKTICDRSKERLLRVSVSTSADEQELLPLLAKDVFKSIVKQKKIKMVQSSFEADDHIASVARILNCPILSNDSDFFIYDVMYIPYSSLEQGVFDRSDGHGLVKRCKIYKSDYFLQNFNGMDKKCLPLAAALLGNDYISTNVFQGFFSNMKVSRRIKQEFSKRKLHLRIETILRWIQRYSLNDAVAIVISSLDPDNKQQILEILEVIINGYLIPKSTMLGPLGYSQEEIDGLMQKMPNESFKFESIDNFQMEDTQFNDDTDISDDELYSTEKYSFFKPTYEEDLKQNIPVWFLYEYNAANFPPYLMDILHRQLIIVSEQMEDLSHPPCVNISLKIIRVIFELISKGTTNSETLKYITRGKGANIFTYELDCKNHSNANFEYPPLENLKDLPLIKRKQILLHTLGVADPSLVIFPPTWRLYIATIKYWMNESDKIFATKYHLYTLVFFIIYHVIKRVISHSSYFEKKVGIEENMKTEDVIVNMSVKDALEKVTKQDSLNANAFFETYKTVDKKNFKINIVHAFSLFQNCLKYSICLNNLLGLPYPQVPIAEFYSGTSIYNFFTDLQKYKALNPRVCKIFENAPSVLQLFVSVSSKIQTILSDNK